jgi:hypothetical protein
VVDYDMRTLRLAWSRWTVAAQREESHGAEPTIKDVRESLYAFDGDQHVEVHGTMFEPVIDKPAWRPAAARLLEEAFDLASSLSALPAR